MASKRVLTQQGESWKLSGDTFTIKEELKRIGARYDGAQRCWFIEASDKNQKKLELLGFLSLHNAQVRESSNDPFSIPPQTEFAEVHLENTTDHSQFTVSQFTLHVENILQKHLSFDFWIVGEISSLKTSSGHCYFDLVEPAEERSLQTGRAASVSCCLWAGKIRRLADKFAQIQLSEGMKIKIKAHCEFRKEGSRLSVIVNDIDPQFTLGDLALQRQNIIRELKRRNLYDRQRETSRWPSFPLRIALITAAGSRAQTDFIDELNVSGLHFSVVMYDCHMQGERVEQDVVTAFEMISSELEDAIDCVVITRGGGSRLDLRWFDNLEVCKSIAYCRLPVLTAIGHFEDVSIADEVASVAEKTPTGAARYLCQRVSVQFENLLTRLERQANRSRSRLASERSNLERSELRLEQLISRRIERESNSLHEHYRTLNLIKKTSLQPMKRGFSLLRSNEGNLLKADDFLTSEKPKRVQIEMQSLKKNAVILINAEVVSAHIQKDHSTETTKPDTDSASEIAQEENRNG
jgi:exodeoxyribonuclease VII large subunit